MKKKVKVKVIQEMESLKQLQMNQMSNSINHSWPKIMKSVIPSLQKTPNTQINTNNMEKPLMIPTRIIF